jgi:hypothetical protein
LSQGGAKEGDFILIFTPMITELITITVMTLIGRKSIAFRVFGGH